MLKFITLGKKGGANHPPKGPQTRSARGGGRYTMTMMMIMLMIMMMMMMMTMMTMMIMMCFLDTKRPLARLAPWGGQ